MTVPCRVCSHAKAAHGWSGDGQCQCCAAGTYEHFFDEFALSDWDRGCLIMDRMIDEYLIARYKAISLSGAQMAASAATMLELDCDAVNRDLTRWIGEQLDRPASREEGFGGESHG